jgi:hypothetical protein
MRVDAQFVAIPRSSGLKARSFKIAKHSMLQQWNDENRQSTLIMNYFILYGYGALQNNITSDYSVR